MQRKQPRPISKQSPAAAAEVWDGATTLRDLADSARNSSGEFAGSVLETSKHCNPDQDLSAEEWEAAIQLSTIWGEFVETLDGLRLEVFACHADSFYQLVSHLAVQACLAARRAGSAADHAFSTAHRITALSSEAGSRGGQQAVKDQQELAKLQQQAAEAAFEAKLAQSEALTASSACRTAVAAFKLWYPISSSAAGLARMVVYNSLGSSEFGASIRNKLTNFVTLCPDGFKECVSQAKARAVLAGVEDVVEFMQPIYDAAARSILEQQGMLEHESIQLPARLVVVNEAVGCAASVGEAVQKAQQLKWQILQGAVAATSANQQQQHPSANQIQEQLGASKEIQGLKLGSGQSSAAAGAGVEGDEQSLVQLEGLIEGWCTKAQAAYATCQGIWQEV